MCTCTLENYKYIQIYPMKWWYMYLANEDVIVGPEIRYELPLYAVITGPEIFETSFYCIHQNNLSPPVLLWGRWSSASLGKVDSWTPSNSLPSPVSVHHYGAHRLEFRHSSPLGSWDYHAAEQCLSEHTNMYIYRGGNTCMSMKLGICLWNQKYWIQLSGFLEDIIYKIPDGSMIYSGTSEQEIHWG